MFDMLKLLPFNWPNYLMVLLISLQRFFLLIKQFLSNFLKILHEFVIFLIYFTFFALFFEFVKFVQKIIFLNIWRAGFIILSATFAAKLHLSGSISVVLSLEYVKFLLILVLFLIFENCLFYQLVVVKTFEIYFFKIFFAFLGSSLDLFLFCWVSGADKAIFLVASRWVGALTWRS